MQEAKMSEYKQLATEVGDTRDERPEQGDLDLRDERELYKRTREDIEGTTDLQAAFKKLNEAINPTVDARPNDLMNLMRVVDFLQSTAKSGASTMTGEEYERKKRMITEALNEGVLQNHLNSLSQTIKNLSGSALYDRHVVGSYIRELDYVENNLKGIEVPLLQQLVLVRRTLEESDRSRVA